MVPCVRRSHRQVAVPPGFGWNSLYQPLNDLGCFEMPLGYSFVDEEASKMLPRDIFSGRSEFGQSFKTSSTPRARSIPLCQVYHLLPNSILERVICKTFSIKPHSLFAGRILPGVHGSSIFSRLGQI